MTFNKLAAAFSAVLLVSCAIPSSSDPTSSDGSGGGTVTGPTVVGDTFNNANSYAAIGAAGATPNTMSVTVNGANCGARANQYSNEPCVSVTICSVSDSSQCQVINNLLLDTGSYGLRIFSSVITIPMVPITHGSDTLAECSQFGDGTTLWGPVQYAYVQLGTEKSFAMPIQTVDQDYKTAPDYCAGIQGYPGLDPAESGFNGILGIGMVATDCPSCTTDGLIGQYYTCTAAGDCSQGAKVGTAAQVANPVAMLDIDNNGTILTFLTGPGSTGAASLTGTLYLGIDTRTNNNTTGTGLNLTRYNANSYLNFKTVFAAYNSSSMPAFIDSGSNFYYMPAPSDGSLPDCGDAHSGYAGFFCPASEQTLTAVTKSSDNSASTTITFKVSNAYTLTRNGNYVFGNVAGSYGTDSSSANFDWGLPFFFNRSVATGIAGKTSTHLGTGPYWGY